MPCYAQEVPCQLEDFQGRPDTQIPAALAAPGLKLATASH